MAERNEQTIQRMNRMADLLANGTCETAAEAARVMNLSKGEGVRLWHSMRQDLGLAQCV